MGISRDRRHKHRKTGGRFPVHQKKRKHELGRPAAVTKLGSKRVRPVRCRGGNIKHRAIRLDTGNYCWASQSAFRSSLLSLPGPSGRPAFLSRSFSLLLFAGSPPLPSAPGPPGVCTPRRTPPGSPGAPLTCFSAFPAQSTGRFWRVSVAEWAVPEVPRVALIGGLFLFRFSQNLNLKRVRGGLFPLRFSKA